MELSACLSSIVIEIYCIDKHVNSIHAILDNIHHYSSHDMSQVELSAFVHCAVNISTCAKTNITKRHCTIFPLSSSFHFNSSFLQDLLIHNNFFYN